MKYYIIAGEASGDLHASFLMKALKKRDEAAQFRVWGGDLMEKEGGVVVKHYRDLAFMGFVEVVKNLRTIWQNLQFCKRDILDCKPDRLIFIDYPGFNLRIAEFAKKQGFKTFYYISPQVWAWHTSRVKKMKQIIDHLFVILPFEADFYQQWNWKVDFVGHPLLDVFAARKQYWQAIKRTDLGLERIDKPIVALLPGSRKQEIKRMLPILLSVVPHFPNYQFVIAGAPALPPSFYTNLIAEKGGDTAIPIVANQTYELLTLSQAALVTSGTATLETALLNVPQIVCYKANYLSYHIARWLVSDWVKYISLVNLIADQEIVKELIQDDLTVEQLCKELTAILENSDRRAFIQQQYTLLHQQLGGGGAADRVAERIIRN